jgi:hypothetical protein
MYPFFINMNSQCHVLQYLGHFEIWCWRRMEKISRNDQVRNEEVFCRAKEERNILHRVNIKKDNCIGHVLRRNCLIQHII